MSFAGFLRLFSRQLSLPKPCVCSVRMSSSPKVLDLDVCFSSENPCHYQGDSLGTVLRNARMTIAILAQGERLELEKERASSRQLQYRYPDCLVGIVGGISLPRQSDVCIRRGVGE